VDHLLGTEGPLFSGMFSPYRRLGYPSPFNPRALLRFKAYCCAVVDAAPDIGRAGQGRSGQTMLGVQYSEDLDVFPDANSCQKALLFW
jgi:hypothetical protein